MTEVRALAAIAARRPMDTDIFALRRAQQAGHVKCDQSGPGVQWSLTDAGRQALAESGEQA